MGEASVDLSLITTCIIALGLLLTVCCIIRLGASYRAERQRYEDAAGEREGGREGLRGWKLSKRKGFLRGAPPVVCQDEADNPELSTLGDHGAGGHSSTCR
ncbi:MAG: hypothetical protein ISS56_04290 [Anaerolineae bacterium]|nr:hypothetical protein [Anaerolineae bacterium]